MQSTTFEATWEEVNSGLQKILRSVPISVQEYMKHFSSVYSLIQFQKDVLSTEDEMIGNGCGKEIFAALTKSLQEFLSREFKKIDEIAEEEAQLTHYARLWWHFEFASKVVDGLFRYLNNHWIKRAIEEKREGVFHVQTLCMVSWSRALFGDCNLNIAKIALELLKRDRDGEQGVNLDLLRQVANSCVAMGIEFKKESNGFLEIEELDTDEDGMLMSEREQLQIYEEHFERPLLENTYAYYKKEAEELRTEAEIVRFMKKTQARIQEEVERSERFFHHQLTGKRIQKSVQNAFVVDHLEFFRQEFVKLLDSESFEKVTTMFRLCENVQEAICQLRIDFEEFVASKGRQAISQISPAEQNDPKTYVAAVLKFYEDHSELVERAFQGEHGFRGAFDSGCRQVVNKNCITEKSPKSSKSAELLARYADAMLRKGGNKENEDVERVFDRLMKVFVLLEDKDVFQSHSNKLLARRLLHDLSTSEDSERLLLARMKNACGHSFTHTAAKMFTDIDTSKTLSTTFKEAKKSPLEMTTQVLSSGFWSLSQNYTFNIPKVLETRISDYSKFYSEKYQGRKLTWLLNHSRGELYFRAASRKFLFTVTTAQMVVLLKFNDVDVLTRPQLQRELDIPAEVLNSVLASLVKADLLKLPSRTTFSSALPGDTSFALNQKFISKKVKMDLSKLQMAARSEVEVKKEQSEMERDLEKDREFVIQATIVRVMKMRKRVQHTSLITEVLEQVSLRFKPKVAMVKKCVDILIEKDYLKRADDSKDFYEYIS